MRRAEHCRFKQGYKNVINEAIRLNEAGEYAPAIRRADTRP
ncbi:MAG: hypothetical protein ACLRSW_13640 [Christensenellaceae bacterium]